VLFMRSDKGKMRKLDFISQAILCHKVGYLTVGRAGYGG
jgi:hypothetical protein